MIYPQDTRKQAPPVSQEPSKPTGAGQRKIPLQLKVVFALTLLICLVAAGFLFLQNGRGTPGAPANTITPVLSKPWCAAPDALVNNFTGGSLASLGPNDVWSAGTMIEHWDGKNWSTSYTALTAFDSLRGIVELAPNNVWAVGEHQLKGMASQPLVLHWDGAQWQKIAAPEVAAGGKNALVAIAGSSASDLWAVGFAVPLQGPMVPLLEHWNGTQWALAHLSSSASLQFTSVKVLSPRDAWAVGYAYSSHAGKNVIQPVTEHWNGGKWSAVANPDLGANGGGNLYSINGDSASDLWAVGSQNNGSQLLTEHWDGAKWSIVVNPSVAPSNSNWLASVVVTGPNNVWTVGRVSGSDGFQPFVEHWNGSQWEVLQDPTGSAGELDTITSVGSQFWITGLPRAAGGHAFVETLCP